VSDRALGRVSWSLSSFRAPQKRPIRKFTDAQRAGLAAAFSANPRPDGPSRNAIAERLGLTPKNVKIYFSNRRAKDRRDKLQKEQQEEIVKKSEAEPLPEQHQTQPEEEGEEDSVERVAAASKRAVSTGTWSVPEASPEKRAKKTSPSDNTLAEVDLNVRGSESGQETATLFLR